MTRKENTTPRLNQYEKKLMSKPLNRPKAIEKLLRYEARADGRRIIELIENVLALILIRIFEQARRLVLFDEEVVL